MAQQLCLAFERSHVLRRWSRWHRGMCYYTHGHPWKPKTARADRELEEYELNCTTAIIINAWSRAVGPAAVTLNWSPGFILVNVCLKPSVRGEQWLVGFYHQLRNQTSYLSTTAEVWYTRCASIRKKNVRWYFETLSLNLHCGFCDLVLMFCCCCCFSCKMWLFN